MQTDKIDFEKEKIHRIYKEKEQFIIYRNITRFSSDVDKAHFIAA